MAEPKDDLLAQVTPGNFSPDYAAEQVNTDPSQVLARQVAPHAAGLPPVHRKIAADEANYTEGGQPPFVCGNCRYMSFDAQASWCQIVEGPYPGGEIDKADTCRFFLAAPVRSTATTKDESRIKKDDTSPPVQAPVQEAPPDEQPVE